MAFNRNSKTCASKRILKRLKLNIIHFEYSKYNTVSIGKVTDPCGRASNYDGIKS